MIVVFTKHLPNVAEQAGVRRIRGILIVAMVGLGLVSGAGSGIATSPGPGDFVHIDGMVTDTDGSPARNASVLIGEFAMLDKLSPENLREVMAGNPQDVRVVPVDEDGEFETDVAWEQAEAAVAISETGISDTVRLSRENATLVFQLYPNRPQRVYGHAGSVAADEEEARLYVSLRNNDDTPIENLSVTISTLPAGWSITTVDTDGAYRSENHQIVWGTIEAGGEIDTTVHLSIPGDTAVGEYTIDLTADSDTHVVQVAPVTVERRPETTAGPTTTGGYGGPGADGSTGTTTVSRRPGVTDESEEPTNTGTATSQHGFTSLLAIVALVGVLLLMARQR